MFFFFQNAFNLSKKNSTIRAILNSLPDDKISDQSKFKAFTDNKMILAQKSKFMLGRVGNIVGKCWLPAFSRFPTMLSKAFFSRGVKSKDCMVKG